MNPIFQTINFRIMERYKGCTILAFRAKGGWRASTGRKGWMGRVHRTLYGAVSAAKASLRGDFDESWKGWW